MNVPSNIAAWLPAPRYPEPGKYKLRVPDYLLLDEAGAFRGEETELVNGDVIVMSPEWIPHMRVKDELAYRLRRAIEAAGLDLIVGTGGTVGLSDVDMPRPDIMVLQNLAGDKAIPRDALLLAVEVSSTTFSFDVGEKAVVYARYGLPEYWVVDVNGRMIYRMWSPAGEAYDKQDKTPFRERIRAATISNLEIATDEL